MRRKKRILIVDDEEKIAEVLKTYLENAGYEAICANSGADALNIINMRSLDLVVLDLMLPDVSGEDICRAIRKKARTPVIMLTAKVAEQDIVNGLEIGADDYITKPFGNKEFLARVEAVLRRAAEDPIPIAGKISYNGGDLFINVMRLEVRKRNKPISLTPSEYAILMTLIKYPSKTFTREELISFAISDDYDGFDRVVDTHIKNIRQKIEDDSKAPVYILTAHGIGYKFGGERDED